MNVIAAWHRPFKPLSGAEALEKELKRLDLTAQKTNGVGISIFKAFGVFLGLIVGSVVYALGWIPAAFFKMARKDNKPRDELNKGYSQTVVDKAALVLINPAQFTAPADWMGNPTVYSEKEQFERDVSELKKNIKTYKPEELRKQLAKLGGSLIYQDLKSANHSSALYLQDLAVAIESVNIDRLLKLYGSERLQNQRTSTISEFGTNLLKAQSQMPNTRNTLCGKIAWSLTNWEKIPALVRARIDPLHYEPYEGHLLNRTTLVNGNHEIQLKFSPTLTGPLSLVENLLIPGYRRHKKSWVHIDNQSSDKASERARINQVHKWSQENPDVFLHAVISSNTGRKITKDIVRTFIKNKGVTKEMFIDAYFKAICGDQNQYVRDFEKMRGIYIPQELLSDDELTQVLAVAKNIAAFLFDGDRKKFAKITGRILNEVLIWAIMKKEQTQHYRSIFSTGCKETVDRGPFENLAMFAMDLISRGKYDLTPEEQQLWVGITLGRGDVAANRAPEKKRPLQFQQVASALLMRQAQVRTELQKLLRLFNETPTDQLEAASATSSGTPSPRDASTERREHHESTLHS
jgi:hypothetical protein